MEAKDAALWRVGRNIANLQKLELALRTLLPLLRVSGTVDEIKSQIEQSKKRVKKVGLGELAQELHATVFKEPSAAEPPEVLTQPVLSFSMRLDGTDEFVRTFKARWRRLVVQRNRLVHSQLREYDLTKVEDCSRLSSVLDAQNDEICAMVAELTSIHTYRVQFVKAVIERLDDGTFFRPTDAEPDGA